MSEDEAVRARTALPAGAVIRDDANGRLYLKTETVWWRALHGDSVSPAPYAPGRTFTVLWPPVVENEGEK